MVSVFALILFGLIIWLLKETDIICWVLHFNSAYVICAVWINKLLWKNNISVAEGGENGWEDVMLKVVNLFDFLLRACVVNLLGD